MPDRSGTTYLVKFIDKEEQSMKRILILLFVTGLLVVGSFSIILAAELTGREIALKMDAVDTSLDGKRTAVMVINRKEHKLVRKMESFTKKYGPDERMIIRFIEPPDVRGVMYLT